MKLKEYALKWIYETPTPIFDVQFRLSSPWPSGLGRQTISDHPITNLDFSCKFVRASGEKHASRHARLESSWHAKKTY